MGLSHYLKSIAGQAKREFSMLILRLIFNVIY